MSGWRAASGADEDLSPDQSRPVLTAAVGPILKLDKSPSPWPALLALPHGRTQPGTPLPTEFCMASMTHTLMLTHLSAHTIPSGRAGHPLGPDRREMDGGMEG